jgi:hypothetical protein
MQTNVSFQVQTGDDAPDEVTQALGIPADEINERGKPRPLQPTQRTPQIATRNRWVLRTRLPEEASPEEHLADMMTRIGPHVDALSSLRQRGHVVLLVVVAYIPIDEQSGQWTFDEETVAWIAACGARLETAVYPMPPSR